MQRLFPILLIFLTAFGVGGCKKNIDSTVTVLPASIQIGKLYYSQVTMQQEKGRYRTSNYRRGFLIPVNTKISLVSIDGKHITVKLVDSNQVLLIENVKKHTNDKPYEAFEKLFSQQKVGLSKFTKEEQAFIALGKVEKGMSKKAVVVAIGYPPKTKTPSLDVNQWRYWSSRFNTFLVHFEKDKVVRIQD